MGTRGYKVYRYKGYYFVYYNHHDSYPTVFGVQVLDEVPRNPGSFKRWLVGMKEFLDDLLESKRLAQEDVDVDVAHDVAIVRVQPTNDLFIEWVYELDLDNLVFLVDSEPLYNLSHLPPHEIFLETIGSDHYGHRAYDKSTPKEYRYDWTAPPPVVDDSRLVTYNANCKEPVTLQPHELLGVPVSFSKCESVRIHFLEVLLGSVMRTPCVGHSVRKLENVPARGDILPEMSSLALLMAEITTGPAIFQRDKDAHKTEDFVWLRSNLCLFITTHLSDERNMQAAVAELVEEVLANDKIGVVYGVVFSIFDCVVVSIDVDSGGFKHTPVLQFLPSFYAESPSTPGLTALARLGYMLDIDPVSFMPQVLTTSFSNDSAISKVPLEIWQKIAWNLSIKDLIAMGSLTALCRHAAVELLRYPHVGDCRLTSFIPPPHEKGSEDNERLTSLAHGSFEAASDGNLGLVVEINPVHRQDVKLGYIMFHRRRLLIQVMYSIAGE